MQAFRAAGLSLSDVLTSRLASHAAASCSVVNAITGQHHKPSGADYVCSSRRHLSGIDQAQAPAGAAAGNSKITSPDQPGDSPEAELTRIRAKRLTRADKPSYLENEDFEEELKQNSILVEPDIPIYDLREVLQQVGLPVGPRAPLFDQLQGLPLDSPQLQMLLTEEKEEEPPFPGARRILEWEQSIVLSHGSFAGEHPKNRKAVCRVHLRELQQQAGLTEEALQLIARVCGQRYQPNTGILTLVSEKHSMREENRRHIMELLSQLVAEGHQAFPSQNAEQPTNKEQKQQTA